MSDNMKEEVIIVSVNYLLRNKKVTDEEVKKAFEFATSDFSNLDFCFDEVREEILRRYNYQMNYFKGLELLDSLDK